MRRLIALTLLGLILLAAVGVLWWLGGIGIDQEARGLAREQRERRALALHGVGRELSSELQALLRREGERPFYHWRHLYLPPDLVAKNPALVPSPIGGEPPDRLVELYFEVRASVGCASPAFLDGPLAGADAPNDFAEAIRGRLLELGARTRDIEQAYGERQPFARALPTAATSSEPPSYFPPVPVFPAADPLALPPIEAVDGFAAAESIEVMDVYVCRENSGLKPVLNTSNEIAEDQQTQGLWNAYQDRAGQTGGKYVPRGKSSGRAQSDGRQSRGQQQEQTRAIEPQQGQTQAQTAEQQKEPPQKAASPSPPPPAHEAPIGPERPPPPPIQGEVEVRRTPFRLIPLGPRDPSGWPTWILAVREVTLPREVGAPDGSAQWLQGFALHMPRIKDELLPRLIDRLVREAELPRAADLAERIGGSLVPDAPPQVAFVEVGAVPAGSPSVVLPAPFERVALVHQAPLPDPHQLLLGSRRLLDGALLLALGVVALGGAILLRAALAERRLARQRSDFVAALTHELKAPLTGIRALAELLHEQVVTAEPQRLEYYASILGESQRLSRLVQNVLDASRLERGAALPVSCGPLELGPLLEELTRGLRPPLAAVGVALELEGAQDLPAVLADREAVGQVLSNLLDNAAKYGRGEKALVKVSARTNGPRVEVDVRDHGPGVAPGEREQVFERFWRSPHAPREVGGAGLGLWIAREQARAMGGDLSLVAIEGAGACFRLALPILPGKAA